MIIIQLQGGLGNQMFQYALGMKLESLGRTVRYHYTASSAGPAHAGRLQLQVFGPDIVPASEKELRRFGQGQSILGRAERKLGSVLGHPQRGKGKTDVEETAVGYSGSAGTEGTHKPGPFVYEDDLSAGYQPRVLEMDDVYLRGYWQTERYFRDIKETILERFRFPDRLDPRGEALRERILKTNAVSVHVRRGDYLTLGRVYGGICTEDYYRRAMERMRQELDAPVFYVFSDDPVWVKENWKGPDIVPVDAPAPEDAWMDMALMTQCRGNIVANSSFSWWGAWLNRREDAVTAAPSRWLANHDVTDAICEDWIQIKV